MTTRERIDKFLAERELAVVGVSRSGKKFGNYAYRALRERGYRLFPIHPHAETLEGDRAYVGLDALPERVGGVMVAVPPPEAERVIRAAAAAGMKRVWLQQGSESPEALRLCEEFGIAVVHGQCILMFAEPVRSGHKLHRWIWRLLGKLPR